MDIATGALNTLLPKLGELVVGEYKLQSGVNGEIKELEKELESMRAVLHNMAEMPAEQLDELARIWANDVRELSYDIEDTVDTFMLRSKVHKHIKRFSIKDEAWEINLLIDKTIEFLKNRRRMCVIDDVWKESAWDTIKLALQDGSYGSKIIITTRNKAVAGHVGGGVYELKPLSEYDSKLILLLNKRIFDAEDGCPPSFREVTGNILKKCGGVPLAIITTASLLASKPMHLQDWEKVNSSIGFGLERNPDVEKMKSILCLSYNDLPPHLKTFLLYLSKYPEDMRIRKDILILSWLAEGFITHYGEPSGKSLPEIGEGYFNELINRSLIQPVYNNSPFTKFNADLHMFAETEQRKIRRVTLHNSNKSYTSQEAREQLFKVDDCSGLDDNHLKDLGKLNLLRFLRLQGLRVTELPKSIGMLECLETLDIRGNRSVIMLPVSFGNLGKLVRLLTTGVELSDGLTLENMRSLQVLEGICATNSHTRTEICKLRKLESLGLQIGRTLREWSSTGNSNEFIVMLGEDVCVLPEHLEKLAELPSLRFLRLRFDVFEKHELLIIPCGASAFPCLTDLDFQCGLMLLKFQHGAMQKLQRLCLKFNVKLRNDTLETVNNFDYGLENLPSLRHVVVYRSVRKSTEAQYSIVKAITDHPNHPVRSFV
ncbi:unnamed protein product [Urochloa decumbens]|uniref:Uncharacterized protein n=1 Tax=Urochloa decumbens TaxID=240449 RepID=A0ABC9F071_9POAL